MAKSMKYPDVKFTHEMQGIRGERIKRYIKSVDEIHSFRSAVLALIDIGLDSLVQNKSKAA